MGIQWLEVTVYVGKYWCGRDLPKYSDTIEDLSSDLLE